MECDSCFRWLLLSKTAERVGALPAKMGFDEAANSLFFNQIMDVLQHDPQLKIGRLNA
jgi:hypothetical protein